MAMVEDPSEPQRCIDDPVSVDVLAKRQPVSSDCCCEPRVQAQIRIGQLSEPGNPIGQMSKPGGRTFTFAGRIVTLQAGGRRGGNSSFCPALLELAFARRLRALHSSFRFKFNNVHG